MSTSALPTSSNVALRCGERRKGRKGVKEGGIEIDRCTCINRERETSNK
jgi:hypothetical protein